MTKIVIPDELFPQARITKDPLTIIDPNFDLQDLIDAGANIIEAPQFQASEGRKDDSGKVRMELVPPELMFAVGTILTFGADKYEDRNWEKGMSWGRVFGALMRHMWAWWGGKGPVTKNFLFGELDDETGHSHLWHAACCLTFLIAYEERAVGTDDRHTTSN